VHVWDVAVQRQPPAALTRLQQQQRHIITINASIHRTQQEQQANGQKEQLLAKPVLLPNHNLVVTTPTAAAPVQLYLYHPGTLLHTVRHPGCKLHTELHSAAAAAAAALDAHTTCRCCVSLLLLLLPLLLLPLLLLPLLLRCAHHKLAQCRHQQPEVRS
jgi:hypothetical protein